MEISKQNNKASHSKAKGSSPSGQTAIVEPDKVVVVTRQTRLEESIKRFNTISQAKYFIESRGQSFDDYVLEYDNYQRARDSLVRSIPSEQRFQVVDRTMLPNFLFGPQDLVVTLGQDGLVVNAAKYLNGQPVLAFNPDPQRFDGVLLPFLWHDSTRALTQALNGKLGRREISMARADLNDGQSLYAFNDFFVGARTHVSARYTLHYKNAQERHSSSGVIVSTPAGSTGWLSSLFNMADGIERFQNSRAFSSKAREKQGHAKKSKGPDKKTSRVEENGKGPQNQERPDMDGGAGSSPVLNWEERKLIFVVREPFRSNWSGADIVAGNIIENDQLVLESHMPEGGVIFSDGMLEDFMEFNSGATVRIGLAEKSTGLLVPNGSP